MNKSAIKNFAVWARETLMSEIRLKANGLGIHGDIVAEKLDSSTKDVHFFDIGTGTVVELSGDTLRHRNQLANHIKEKAKQSDYPTAYESVMEEVAYTWFNRLVAIRFMEVNDYLPSKLRVLSSETTGKQEPDLVTTPFEAEFDWTEAEKSEVRQLQTEGGQDPLFRYLFRKQCAELNKILPKLFEPTTKYMDLLLNFSYISKDSVIYRLVNDIPEEDFREAVEIVGWMFQFYNTEPKAQVDAKTKKGGKVSKEEIPAKTQLFTPNWIVKYMVENSLGRLWLEGNPNIDLIEKWKYYLDEAEQTPEVQNLLEKQRSEQNLVLEEIRFLDPCMGSGHILVYAFDVFIEIYRSQGYSDRDSAQNILLHNLYGLDIDPRAFQLSYFALMMKARSYDRRFFSRGISPNIQAVPDSNGIERIILFDRKSDDGKKQGEYLTIQSQEILSDTLKVDSPVLKHITALLDIYHDGQQNGSLSKYIDYDYNIIENFFTELERKDALSISDHLLLNLVYPKLEELHEVSMILFSKYDIVCTNPPYMGTSMANPTLGKFIKDKYPDSKADLFAAFIDQDLCLIKPNGYNCAVTMQSWMFLSSYEKLRNKILKSKTLTHLMHMENNVMGIAFGTAVSNIKNTFIPDYKGTFNHITYKDIGEDGIPTSFPVQGNRFAQISSENFSKIPGSPIAYWVSERMLEVFEEGTKLGDMAKPRQGMATGKNAEFLRLWNEISYNKFYNSKETKKWFPYNKGGNYRKWYGNLEYVVNWENDGFAIKEDKRKNLELGLIEKKNSKCWNSEFYFLDSITWSKVSSGSFSVRFVKGYGIFDVAGCSIFAEESKLFELMSFLNSKVLNSLIEAISPTINYEVGQINILPILDKLTSNNNTSKIAKYCMQLSKTDWDSFETSWDFEKHPLLSGHSLKSAFEAWETDCKTRFDTLKSNEEELNRLFIEIYGLEEELTPEVEDKDVTVRLADLQRDIKSLISYAVGCIFGRYSLDCNGLAFAGGDWDESKYETFQPVKNNCVIITEENFFPEDLGNLVAKFLETVYGRDTLEENLKFIATALGGKGGDPMDTLRGYLVKDFYKDHVKIYQKRPIYWLYDAGKKHGFKALVYMHRFDEKTTATVCNLYLEDVQRGYEEALKDLQIAQEVTTSSKDIAKLEKKREVINKKLVELKDYYSKIDHMGRQRITIDLDDGVKVNYEKVQVDKNAVKYEILSKI